LETYRNKFSQRRLTRLLRLKFYYSDKCGHCRRLETTLDKISRERGVEVERICIDNGGYDDIKYTPTVAVLYGDIELGRFTSALAKSQIDKWLDELEVYINTYL
jgi:thioredoxin-like negative regulator of GroEL